MANHSKFSASASERWLQCPASIQAEQSHPSKSSPFAQEGTRAHTVAELALSNGTDANKYLGLELEGGTVDEDMVRYVQMYLDYVRNVECTAKDALLLCEQRVDYTHLAPDGYGTLDSAVIIPSEKVAHIFDLKYGKGVVVSAENNSQAMFYASGLLYEYGFAFEIDKFFIHIVQPRVNNFSEWAVSTAELLNWQNSIVVPAVEDALSDTPTYQPTDSACRWCKAKASCKALHKVINDEVIDAFDGVTDADKRKILDFKPLFMSLLNAIEEEVYDRLSVGGNFDGYKLVKGRSTTKWTADADAALSIKYGDSFYSKKPIGVTEGRKLLDKEEFSQFTFKSEGAPKLVKETEKGEPITLVDFEKIT